jgi:gamma-glutamylcyclotransferase (GGCT)/AIG2-like uncharacterized protein YtfP
MLNKIFVYGSLKKEFLNHSRIDKYIKKDNSCSFVNSNSAKTIDKYLLFPSKDFVFPYMLKKQEIEKYYKSKNEEFFYEEKKYLSQKESQIYGELYEVDEEVISLEEFFKMKDFFEGYIELNHNKSYYIREVIKIEDAKGNVVEAYTYIGNFKKIKGNLYIGDDSGIVDFWIEYFDKIGIEK